MNKKYGLLMLTCVSCTSHATQVFELEGFGAVSRAMGGSSSAYYTGNSALISNPATLSLHSGDKEGRFELGLDVVTTDIHSENAAGERANSKDLSKNRGPYFAPQLSYVTKKEKWHWGAGLFASGGLGTEFESNSFLSRTENGTQTDFENSSRLLVLRAPVGFGYEANEKFTFGASADLVWTALNLELLLPASQVGGLAAGGYLSGALVGPLAGFVGTGGAAHFSLSRDEFTGGKVDAVGMGGRLGFTYQLSPTTTIGGMYNLKTSVGDLEGRATLSAIDGTGAVLPLQGDIKIKDFEMPASLSFGVAHQLTPSLLMAADIKRTYWKDVMEDISVSFTSPGGGIDIVLPHNYSDVTITSVGAAYQLNEDIVLRGGFSYAQQALDERFVLPVIPAYLKKHLTAGGSYRLGPHSSIDLALSLGLKETLTTPSYVSGTESIKHSHRQFNAVIAYARHF